MTRRNFIDTQAVLAYGLHPDAQEASAQGAWLADRSFIDRFIELVPAEGSILDIGAGSGNQAKYFLEHHLRVAITEGSLEMLEIAQRQAPMVEGRVGILPNIPFAKRQFDGIFSRHVLHHLALPNLKISIKNMHSLLKKGGRIAFIVPVSTNSYVEHDWWNIDNEDYIQINRYPVSTVREILAGFGFMTIVDEIVYEQDVAILRVIALKPDEE